MFNHVTLHVVEAYSLQTEFWYLIGENFYIPIMEAVFKERIMWYICFCLLYEVPPVVQNETVVFETNSWPRTLECKVLGVPGNYTFSKWLHYTYNNQQIRILEGLGNGTLILPNREKLMLRRHCIVQTEAIEVFLALAKRLCLKISLHRNDISQDNGVTHITHEHQYDEIDSVHYNPPNVNGRPEVLLNNNPFETLLSSNNDRHIASIATDDDRTAYYNNDINLRERDSNIFRADNVSMRSSSNDSYLVPCGKYINIEIGVADKHNEQMGEQ
ncbi:unnamed protein product [Mytilus coruscus]|uniref:Uncharacterized protein n=1 Tax=Mytilus coruscus TaxID=42192 RepID=A0A6J8CYU7_MYTCO|nr:unnamed protein product [Mytilus coruscus]